MDAALAQGDTATILSVQSKMSWIDFRCEKYDYEKSWKKFPEERQEFEESVSPAALVAMRSARTRYHLSCGFRPAQNPKCLDLVAKMVRDLTEGYLGE